jgi:hypothetical protein
MHVIGMDRRRGDNEAMHPFVRRERIERRARQEAREAEGVVHAVVEDEPLSQVDPDYVQMDIEHQVEDDVEAMEDDVDDGQQQRRRGKRVLEPGPEPLDDYPGVSYDTTLLTRYHVHMARKASEGVVRINVIL